MQRSRFPMISALAMLVLLAAGCHMDVEKTAEGKEKKVDIRTPLGGLKVRTDDVDTKEIGLAIYPGAVEVKESGEDKESKAHVNISTPWFGLRVIAIKFETPDEQDKVVAFYEKELKAHGEITRCNGEIDFKMKDGENRVRCKENLMNRDETKLVVGNERRHRIVSIKKHGEKTGFALVYVNTRGDDTM